VKKRLILVPVLLVPVFAPLLLYELHIVDSDEMIAFMAVGTLPLIIAASILSKMRSRRKRRSFSQSTKDLTMRRQSGRCNRCQKRPHRRHRNFDHINGRWDNSPGNCQMLCLNCHADKTARDRQRRMRETGRQNGALRGLFGGRGPGRRRR